MLCRLTVPPNSLASISLGVTVWLSTKHNRRAVFIIIAAFVAIIGNKFSAKHTFLSSNLVEGYIVLLTTKTASAQYVGIHLAVAGIYTGDALLLR